MTPLRIAALLFPLCLHAAELPPRIAGDFASGKPELEVAPQEKRLGRSTSLGVDDRKHPYSAHGKRLSLLSLVEQDAKGAQLTPRTGLSTGALGALNPRSGTVAGWFRLGGEPGPLLSGRGHFMASYPGTAFWELGLSESGQLTLQTAAGRCEVEEVPWDGWVHIAAVWDADHGVRLYVDGKPAASQWAEATPAADSGLLYDSRREDPRFTRFIFSRGTGDRAMVKLPHQWEGDSVALEEAGSEPSQLVLINQSGQRMQMRSGRFPAPPPGRYELAVEAEGGRWQPRLSLHLSSGGTRYLGLSQGSMQFEVRPEETEAMLSLDLNFSAPGRYKVGGFAVVPASGERGVVAATSGQPVERLVIHPRAEGALTALRVYDAPLSPAGVQALYEGRAPQVAEVEPARTEPEARLTALGWAQPPAATLPVAHAGRTLRFRQAPVLEAQEGKRAAGWLAVSGFPGENFPWGYHGYKQGVPTELHLQLGLAPNWMTGSATGFQGTVREGEAAAAPLVESAPWFQRPLAGGSAELTLRQEAGTLSRLEFYHVGEEAGPLPEGGRAYPLRLAAELPLGGEKALEMISTYPGADRLTFTPYQRESRAKEATALPALATWHLATAPATKEETLGGLALRLRLAPQAEPGRALIVVHDPYTPFRELARVECVLAPSPTGEYTVRLDLRESLLLPGLNLWVSVTLERESALRIGNHGSELVVYPAADAALAAERWKAWEARSVRDRIERLSEPRPWKNVSADPETSWWLALAAPVYGQIDSALLRLMARFPKEHTFRAWYAFTHPDAPASLEEIALPQVGKHPEWAVLTRECLRQYQAFLDFWIDERQIANGEFGHFYGDDTDLVQDWLDMTLISDPRGKVAGSLDLLAHNVATTFTLLGGREGPGSERRVAGQPIIVDGLNVRWTDALHAYEDGLNVQPPDFLAHYGSAVRFERLLATASRYDGFILTPEKEGQRRFASEGEGTAFVNTKYLAGSAADKYWPLMLHAGLTVAWYNDDPALWKLLEEVGRGELAGPRPVRASSGPLLQALFHKTGEVKYVEPLLDAALWKSERIARPEGLSANNLLRLPGLNREATLRELQSDAAERYSNHGSEKLGWSDDRHLRNWLEWQLSGKEEPLLVGLRALYRQWVFLMPAYTLAEQSGDRVSPPKQLISQLYLGGVPGSRNRHFYPDFAVSYRGFGDDFAARVEENTPQKLRVRLYSFAEAPASGELRVWALEPGRYGVVLNGGEPSEHTLRRGEGLPLTLPPGEEFVVEIAQIERSAEPALLPDAAVQQVRREGGAVVVAVCNMGMAPLEAGGTLTLRDAEGKELVKKGLPAVPGVKDWKPGQVVVTFEEAPARATRVEISLESPEITPCNNHAPIPPTPPSAG